jgi:large subunit ribosomal protein L30
MNKENKKIAAIRIKGLIRIETKVEDTLSMLKLYRKNYCVVLEDTPNIIGMLKRSKDTITWGEIDEDTLKLLREKREEKTKNKEGKTIVKKFFRLSPPRGGFERKGTKKPFNAGGALGYRGAKINDLIKKMV